ncbi:MAG: tetratricopeptide repeat protein, partial [Bacteroidota bacterium]
ENALPYLEYYGERSNKMREEDFYQLGFVQYKTGNFDSAIDNFEELSDVDSPLGQNAMYKLGDCYIKTGNKNSARNAFAKASRMTYDKDLQEESLYNYAKLSYELKYDGDAITALQQIPPTSKYHTEAQTIISAIFLNTRDYERAMRIIEGLPNKTPKLRETYQKVAYNRGLQLYRDGDMSDAKRYFKKSQEVPVNQRTNALATYWLGDIAHEEKQFDESAQLMSRFLNLAGNDNRLPDESSVHTANYVQGYNYLKQKKYNQALGYFQNAITGIRQNANFIENDYIKNKVVGDATLRAGDCLFKGNNYNQAIRYYDEAISNRYSGYIYALYQKAIIEGLRGKTVEKILALEKIADTYPNSEYADDALFELGSTYQEIGELNKAVQPLKQLVSQYKDKSDLTNSALIKLGLITYNQGSYQTAINYYKQVFSNNPDPKEAQGALAALEEIYVEDLGQPDEYFAFLESINYDVDSQEKELISFKAAETQFENGNYQRAIEGYNRYLTSYPNGRNSLNAYYNRAESYAVQRDYSNALKDYETVIGRGQSKYYAKALNKAALIAYNHEEDFNKSYDYYTRLEQVASSEDQVFDAQLGALRSAYRTNRPNEINAMARKVVNNPRATDDQKATAYFYMGKYDFDRKNYDAALASFNQVTRLSDNEQTAEARYDIAYIYYVQRELETAKQICINANKESSSYPYWVANSVILLSDILAEQGDLFNARAALEGLIENYDGDAELVATAREKLARLNSQSASSSRLRAPEDPNRLELIENE